MTQCPFCKGRVEVRRIEHVHTWGGKIYVLQNLAADVCTQCGEEFFGPEALQLMDDVVDGKRKPDARVSVPVFSL